MPDRGCESGETSKAILIGGRYVKRLKCTPSARVSVFGGPSTTAGTAVFATLNRTVQRPASGRSGTRIDRRPVTGTTARDVVTPAVRRDDVRLAEQVRVALQLDGHRAAACSRNAYR